MKFKFVIALAIFVLLTMGYKSPPWQPPQNYSVPFFVYLTWQNDPSTTMTVQWHSGVPVINPVLYYREDPEPNAKVMPIREIFAEAHGIPGLPGRIIYRVELTDLKPKTEYSFCCSMPSDSMSKIYRFRTAPDDDSPFTFVVGGDMGISSTARKANARERRDYHAHLKKKTEGDRSDS